MVNEFVSRNIEILGKTKLTVSLRISHQPFYSQDWQNLKFMKNSKFHFIKC